MVTIENYFTTSGRDVIDNFITDQDKRTQAKILEKIDELAILGKDAREPLVKKIVNTPLWELRVKDSTGQYRIFYFIIENNTYILLHGFKKKTEKTPRQEIELALKRMNEYSQRTD